MILLTIFTAAAAIPAALTAIFLVEVLAANREPGKHGTAVVPGARGRIAVLVPAHNESLGIVPILHAILSQLVDGDQIVVVADNCEDDTAAAARAAGGDVVERHDPDRRGKGFALDFGRRHLATHPPDVVIVMDADCRPGPDALSTLAQACRTSGRPCQALYLMLPPSSAPGSRRVPAFTWRIKNWARPLGLKALGLPCQLMGTGMAFPWTVFNDADLATGHLVEDLKLGLDLTRSGHPPLFCPSALVTSEFPSSARGAETQRQRWEGGHLKTIARDAIPLLLESIRRRKLSLLALALDLSVPPLTLLAGLNIAAASLMLVAFVSGLSPIPLIVSTGSVLAFGLAVGLCWHRFGRDLISGRDLIELGPFLTTKLRLYGHILTGRTPVTWVRTDRSQNETSSRGTDE